MIFHTLSGCVLALICLSEARVNLTSSATTVCPGDTLIFTCVSDTGKLAWESNNSNHLYFPSGQPTSVVDIFTINRTSVTGMVLVSTATVHNVQLSHNGSVITCSDPDIPDTVVNGTIQISGPPSSPLNLSSNFSQCALSSVISWVAPLDTPLCVHSYTGTVRNSCNSSQVMVYNTTDNRSSLSITDLTSDDEYSVTVTGRDGAGRLGQESEELIFSRKMEEVTVLDYGFVLDMNKGCGIYLHWNYTDHVLQKYSCFKIKHNVSSYQSPITVINRTNVTLYGVQPGETYTVEITSYPSRCSGSILVQDPKEPNGHHKCSMLNQTSHSPMDSSLSLGNIAAIVSAIILAVVMLCYLLVCLIIYTTTKNSDITSTHRSSAENKEYEEDYFDNKEGIQ